MGSISLEAFDGILIGKLSQWILPSSDFCALPNGFQDQLLSNVTPFQTRILLMSKHDSKAWLLSYSWDLTFVPESPTDWSLILSLLQHLKKPILIVTTPKTNAPPVFWQKCLSINAHTPTCVLLTHTVDDSPHSQAAAAYSISPSSIFFPKLDTLTESQFIQIIHTLPQNVQQSIQSLDLKSVYRDLRGAGASLCLSIIDSRTPTNVSGLVPIYIATWFYPEINGALRLHISDLRMILRTVTERLAEP
jgi:hypothetical protein